MKKFFEVQGSAKEPYKVFFSDETGELNAFCTCPAGVRRNLCKHVFEIVESDNEVRQCFDDYGFGEELIAIHHKLDEAERLKKEVASMKKALGKTILKPIEE